MSMFRNFPRQTTRIGDEFVTITDIFRRVYAKVGINELTELETVTVPEGMTPETVAHKYYNRVDLHWVILIVNNIVDVREEWPKSQSDLVKYCTLKYGSLENIYETHHYENDEGVIVDSDYTDGYKTAISNYDYEEQVNDEKREIKMLKPKYLSEFLKLHASLISR